MMRLLDTNPTIAELQHRRLLRWLDDNLPGYPEGIDDEDDWAVAVEFLYALEHAALLLPANQLSRLLAVLASVNDSGRRLIPADLVPALAQMPCRDFTWLVSRQVADAVARESGEPLEVAAEYWFNGPRFNRQALERVEGPARSNNSMSSVIVD